MARRPGVGSPLNGLFGALFVAANPGPPGGRDVMMPYRQALRILPGHGAAVTSSGGIISLNATGGTGPTGDKGPVGDRGPVGPNGDGAQQILLHDATHSPVGLWQFQGSLADTSGNGYTGTVDAGTEAYTAIAPGVLGVKLGGTLRLALGGTTANLLRITGAVTIEMLMRFTSAASIANPLFGYTYGVDDTSSAFNYLYEVRFKDTFRRPGWFHEHGTGVDDEYNLTDLALPAQRLFHFAARRDANNVIQFFVDGRPFGPPSSPLTAATAGGSSQLYLGGTGGPSAALATSMNVASFKVVAGALTDAQIAAEFNRTAGKFYGSI